MRDVFAEQLCEPDGSTPTRESGSYLFEGDCVPFEEFDAGTLGDVPIRYPTSVHGPVIGTATSDGRPVALTRQRSTFGRDGLNLGALKDMTEGDAATTEDFWRSANKFGFTFNWGYVNRSGIGYFASGYLPERAAGLDRRLPTNGNGDFEWQGVLPLEDHPHAAGHPDDRLVNWNNQSAPGFMHSDTDLYGSVHRVENFDQWPDRAELADVVGVMNRAATEEVRSTVWPVVSEVLRGGDAPSPLAAQAVDILDAWVADDAPLVDADEDGTYDAAGALIFEQLWPGIQRAVLDPVFGSLLDAGVELRGIGADSVVDKDLRTVLGDDVEGPFNLSYCGLGELAELPHRPVDGDRSAHAVARRGTGRRSDDVASRDHPLHLRARAHPQRLPGDEPPDVPAGDRAGAGRLIGAATDVTGVTPGLGRRPDHQGRSLPSATRRAVPFGTPPTALGSPETTCPARESSCSLSWPWPSPPRPDPPWPTCHPSTQRRPCRATPPRVSTTC